jgi:hypothetical protein
VAGRLIYLDDLTRRYAVNFGRPCRIVLDLRAGTIARETSEGGDPDGQGHRVTLPSGYEIKQVVMAGGVSVSSRSAVIPCSAGGQTPTYAVLLIGDGGQRQWVVVAGATGQALRVDDERRVDELFSWLSR